MKIEWQPEDIHAGRRVGNPVRNEQWMIGYIGSMRSDEARWTLVSLTDGMIGKPVTREELAADLNKVGEMPVELMPHAARGRQGGKARAATLTPERRSEIASAAATARWNGGTQG